MNDSHEIQSNGIAAAAFVSAGIGCAALGLLTTLAQMSGGVKHVLNWWNPAGPLSGKSGVAVIIWILSWIVSQAARRRRVGRLSSFVPAGR